MSIEELTKIRAHVSDLHKSYSVLEQELDLIEQRFKDGEMTMAEYIDALHDTYLWAESEGLHWQSA